MKGSRLLRGSTQTAPNLAAQVESCQTGIQSHPNTRGSLKTSFCGVRGPFFLSLSRTEFVPSSIHPWALSDARREPSEVPRHRVQCLRGGDLHATNSQPTERCYSAEHEIIDGREPESWSE